MEAVGFGVALVSRTDWSSYFREVNPGSVKFE